VLLSRGPLRITLAESDCRHFYGFITPTSHMVWVSAGRIVIDLVSNTRASDLYRSCIESTDN
jgi:hypothetical protein